MSARTASGPGPSLRARLLAGFVRRVMKPRSLGPPDPVASRAFTERFTLPALPGVKREDGEVGGVAGEWLTGRGGAAAPTLLFLHGGAFAICSPATHRPLTSAFARRGFRVFVPAYRLAPEHPFPAALEDSVAVCRGLLANGVDPDRLAIAGDSAGGNIALATLVRLRDLGIRGPAAGALFSPWTDLACTGATIRSNAERDPLFHPDQTGATARLYLGETDPRDPLASPFYADFAGLPPLLIHAGDDEILLDDSRRVADRARAAGIEVSFRTFASVVHGWQILAGLLPEATQSVDEAAAFLKARTTGRPARPRA